MKKTIFLLILSTILGLFLIFSNSSYAVESNLVPTASNNIQISLKRKSALVPVNSGYMRVFYDETNNNIGVEYYDDNFKITKKNKIELELDIYGGFYAGNNAYYIVEGQNNVDEIDSQEVIRVIKYDTNWKRIGSANITGNSNYYANKIRYPFNVGCVEMTEVDGKLYIVTGHTGYIDEAVGQGHQGFLMLEVDESALTGKIVSSDLWHSFAQYIDYKDSKLYVLEQSEGSGYTKLTQYDKTNFRKTAVPVLRYGGDRSSTWAQACYASVDGMAISQNNVLCVGTSIDQSEYDNVSSTTAHNIYLTITPMNNFSSDATTVKWLTNYADEGQCFTGLEITKVNDNRFMISWEEYGQTQDMKDIDTLSVNKLHYIFIDENGNNLSKEYVVGATISDCRPIIKGNKIVYYASSENMVDFYTIDSKTGAFNKVIYRVAGENATWSLSDDGILTVSGSGDISIDAKVKYRYPLSRVGGGSYSNRDNAWKSIRDLVNQIVIKEGITNIPEKEFEDFPNLTEVLLPNSMKSIGQSAFQDCEKLRKIVILSNVKSIGEDALWSGYYNYNYNKLCYATIYTTNDSYAKSWAEENGVKYKIIDNLTLTDSKTKTTLKVLGEPTTKLVVNQIESNNNDYVDMKAKASDKYTLFAFKISTEDGECFGDNKLTFNVGKVYKEKEITLVQKKTNGNVEKVTKKADSNGKITITTEELSSFMIAINPSDVVYLLGDVNQDGVVNAKDATLILKYMAKKATLTEEQKLLADTDKDGKIKASDAVRILKYVTKKIEEI